jgi:hypothetical protein
MASPASDRRGVDPVLFGVIALIAVVAIAIVVVLLLRGGSSGTAATDATATTAPATTGPSSSGPAPPATSEDMADGRQFGYFHSVTVAKPTSGAVFDLAQFFTGDAAKQAAAEDGMPGYELDYYIRNTNPRLRNLVIDAKAKVTVIDAKHCCDPKPSSLEDFAKTIQATDGCWVTIENGIVTKIEQQYLP